MDSGCHSGNRNSSRTRSREQVTPLTNRHLSLPVVPRRFASLPVRHGCCSLYVRVREEHMFGILGWIVFGFIVGAVAKLLMPGRDPGGVIVTMLLGIVGAVV